jgi:F420-dependent oxidoreductase-like protein
MPLSFGVHAGVQQTSAADLLAMWRKAEALGFDAISVWDHFYATDPSDSRCFEAVSAHTALAMATTRVQVNCLVYCAGYRHPAVLANAVATIDHFSGGRAQIGLGAGWAKEEYAAYGFPFGTAAERLDRLEESAQCVRALLTEPSVDFAGRYYTLHAARCEPRPLRSALPVWIGGSGEKRTLRMVARHADGWNAPYLTPAAWRRKDEVLRRHCEEAGRDSDSVRRAVNLVLAADEKAFQHGFGPAAQLIRPAALIGCGQQLVDRIGTYADLGVDQINFALRAPFEIEFLESVAGELAASGLASHSRQP